MKRLALVFLTGCSQLLGLSEPQQQADAQGPADAEPDGPQAGVVKVSMGGTGTQGMVTSEPAGIACPGTCEFTFPVGTEVTLTATAPASNQVFTGFFQGGCTGGQSCTITPAGAVEVFARYWRQSNVWFTSSTAQKPGAFDSIGAADDLCDGLAAAAGLPDRTYRAYLPTTTQSAKQRLKELAVAGPAGIYLRPDGELFGGTIEDIEQGTIFFPPRLDEFGRDVGDDALVVTDTFAGGATNTGTHCSDWASETAADVIVGEPAGGTSRFTQVDVRGCDDETRLYCFSAALMEAFATPPPGPSVVFLSFGTVAGNAGLAAMDALCTNEASQAGLTGPTTKALVTPGAGKFVKDRFIGIFFANAAAQRPDSTVISPDMDNLMAGEPFLAAPNVAADKEYRGADLVWVGGDSFNSFQSDCTGWTASAGFGTTRIAATTKAATGAQQTACSGQAHLLCFNGVVAAAKPAADMRHPQATRAKR